MQRFRGKPGQILGVAGGRWASGKRQSAGTRDHSTHRGGARERDDGRASGRGIGAGKGWVTRLRVMLSYPAEARQTQAMLVVGYDGRPGVDVVVSRRQAEAARHCWAQ